VLLVKLLAALNFANVFLNKKPLENKKTLKSVKNVTKITNVKTFFTSMSSRAVFEKTCATTQKRKKSLFGF